MRQTPVNTFEKLYFSCICIFDQLRRKCPSFVSIMLNRAALWIHLQCR